MNSKFLIAFIVCLGSYIFHTMIHLFEYKGYKLAKSKIAHTILTMVISIGYVGWGFMIFSDPVRLDISNYIATPVGLLIGLCGFVIFIWSAKAKRGFNELEHLVTTGIYSKFRNPMYIGIILIHIGFPIASKSLLTLISVLIWTPFIFIWKHMEEKDLEKRFGMEYVEYKKRVKF